jgi:hypothetical protein
MLTVILYVRDKRRRKSDSTKYHWCFSEKYFYKGSKITLQLMCCRHRRNLAANIGGQGQNRTWVLWTQFFLWGSQVRKIGYTRLNPIYKIFLHFHQKWTYSWLTKLFLGTRNKRGEYPPPFCTPQVTPIVVGPVLVSNLFPVSIVLVQWVSDENCYLNKKEDIWIVKRFTWRARRIFEQWNKEPFQKSFFLWRLIKSVAKMLNSGTW